MTYEYEKELLNNVLCAYHMRDKKMVYRKMEKFETIALTDSAAGKALKEIRLNRYDLQKLREVFDKFIDKYYKKEKIGMCVKCGKEDKLTKTNKCQNCKSKLPKKICVCCGELKHHAGYKHCVACLKRKQRTGELKREARKNNGY